VNLDLPVLLVIHRRPAATGRVFETIAAAQPRRLFIAADGPASPSDRKACDETRAVVRNIEWPCEVAHDFSESNLGLNRRMISALDWVFRDSEAAIVLEDDCLPHPHFFRFCASMIDRYRGDPRIVHVRVSAIAVSPLVKIRTSSRSTRWRGDGQRGGAPGGCLIPK